MVDLRLGGEGSPFLLGKILGSRAGYQSDRAPSIVPPSN